MKVIMGLSNQQLLQKATMTTAQFNGAGEAPLTIEQVDQFLRLAIVPQVMLPDVRTVQSGSNKWEESKLDFSARIMNAGTEGQALNSGQQYVPATGIVSISTVLLRGQVPISDEVLEDQVERAGFGDTVMAMVAEAAGRDIEELFIQGDVASSDPYLQLQDGWIKQASTYTGANVYDATSDAQDYQSLFRQMLNTLPNQYKRDIGNLRYYVPKILEEKYRDAIAARGTPLGDLTLSGTEELKYQGIIIKGVPLFPISSNKSNVLLSHRLNLYAGFRREIRLETWRDPREGATSFVVTARVNSQVAHIPATVCAINVDVTV